MIVPDVAERVTEIRNERYAARVPAPGVNNMKLIYYSPILRYHCKVAPFISIFK